MPDSARVDVRNVTAVFCDPDKYPSPDQVRELYDQGAVSAVGIHPKGVTNVANMRHKTNIVTFCISLEIHVSER